MSRAAYLRGTAALAHQSGRSMSLNRLPVTLHLFWPSQVQVFMANGAVSATGKLAGQWFNVGGASAPVEVTVYGGERAIHGSVVVFTSRPGYMVAKGADGSISRYDSSSDLRTVLVTGGSVSRVTTPTVSGADSDAYNLGYSDAMRGDSSVAYSGHASSDYMSGWSAGNAAKLQAALMGADAPKPDDSPKWMPVAFGALLLAMLGGGVWYLLRGDR